MKTTVLKTGKDSIKFNLTQEEILKLADESSVLDSLMKDQENKRKAAADYWKDEIASTRSKLNKAFRLIMDKFEFREVEVDLKFDYQEKKVYTIYAGEVKNTREMTSYEFDTRPKDILPVDSGTKQPEPASEDRSKEIAAKEANMAVKSADGIYQGTEAKTEQSTIMNAAVL